MNLMFMKLHQSIDLLHWGSTACAKITCCYHKKQQASLSGLPGWQVLLWFVLIMWQVDKFTCIKESYRLSDLSARTSLTLFVYLHEFVNIQVHFFLGSKHVILKQCICLTTESKCLGFRKTISLTVTGRVVFVLASLGLLVFIILWGQFAVSDLGN